MYLDLSRPDNTAHFADCYAASISEQTRRSQSPLGGSQAAPPAPPAPYQTPCKPILKKLAPVKPSEKKIKKICSSKTFRRSGTSVLNGSKNCTYLCMRPACKKTGNTSQRQANPKSSLRFVSARSKLQAPPVVYSFARKPHDTQRV